MSKKKITAGVLAIVLLVAGSVWAFRNRSDPQVEKVKQMQAEAFKADATPEQRRATFEMVHKEMEQLSPEQRREVHEGMRENFERQMDVRIKAYFELPRAERVAYMDKQIQEMEKRHQEMAARRSQGGNGPGRGGQQAGGSSGGPQAGQRNANGPRPPRDNSSTARATRRNERLDRSTPEQRALRSAYFADMKKRRIELGLPPTPFHRH